MAKDLFNRYIWLVDTIYNAGKITLDDINRKWMRNALSEGNPIPKKTFHNQRKAIEAMFDINIECTKNKYEYYIDNAEDMERGGVRRWLINSFAVNNLINESHKLKQRILFEDIPSGQQHLTTIIEAMRDGLKLNMSYQAYWMEEPSEFEVKPYFVKVFKQRWYLIGQSDKLRIYSLDRVKSLSPGTSKFKMPSDIQPETFFNDCYGVIIGDDSVAQEIKIKLSRRQANYMRTLPLHHSQQEIETNENYSIFKFFIKPTFDFRQELLSMGEDIVVISPLSFREEMKNIIKKMNVNYD